MAGTLQIVLRNALLDRLDTELPQNSVLEVRTGSKPASVDNAATGTLLASVTLPASPWAAASGGAKSKAGTWATTGITGGTPGWARLRNAGDTRRIDFTVGTSGADLGINLATIATSDPVTVTSLVVTG